MKKILFYLILNILIIHPTLASSKAQTRGSLGLRAVVASAVKARITSHSVNDHQTRILFKAQNNQRHHKVEFQGHKQAGLNTQFRELSMVAGEIDFEILIERLKKEGVQYDPIFIKISAN